VLDGGRGGPGGTEDGRAGGREVTLLLLGVSPDHAGRQLSRTALTYVASLQDEARLTAAGFPARYVYRDREDVFARAESLALDWLSTLDARATALGGGARILFGEEQGFAPWPLAYDALFEIKAGIFDSIFHCLLAAALRAEAGGPLRIVAARGDQLALALARSQGFDVRIEWVDPVPGPPHAQARMSRVVGWWMRADRMLVHPLLVAIRRRLEGRRRQPTNALVGPAGEMAKILPDEHGRLQVEDVYYENLEAALRRRWPGMLKVGITPPKLPQGGWRGTLRVWRLILSGAFRPWYAYAGWANVLATLRARRRYAGILAACDRDPGFAGLFQAGGVDFQALLRPRLLEMLPGMLASARFHAGVAERFVRRENVGRVISVESFSNLGRCMAAALHRRGGQLWGIQGGIISPRRVTNIGFYVAALGGRAGLMADLFFAWGPAYRDVLERFGLPPQRIRVMGFNRAKRLPAPASPRAGAGQVLYIAGGNALVCPYLMTLEEDVHTLRVIAASLPDGAELLVRIHPRHRIEDFRVGLDGLSGVRLLEDGERSLDECLATADCVVGKASTVLLEAAQAGHRVLVVNLAGTPEFTGFTAGEASLPYARDAAQLRHWLAVLLSDPPGMQERLGRFAGAWCADDADVAVARLLAAVDELPTRSALPRAVLFVCSSSLHVTLFAQTIRLLAARADLVPVILSLDRFHAGIHGTASACARALGLPAALIEVDLEPAAGASIFRRIVAAQTDGRRQFGCLIEKLDAALVVVGNDTGHAERAAVQAARAAGRSSMLVQDGYLFDRFPATVAGRLGLALRRLWIAVGGDRLGAVPYGMGGCEVIAAYGRKWAEMLKRSRCGGTRSVEVTGHPGLHVAAAGAWTFPAGQDVVYFCTNFLSGLGDRAAHRRQVDEIGSLRQVMTERLGAGAVLHVRLHPGDAMQDYAALDRVPGVRLQQHEDLATTIRGAWLCVTNISSVALSCLAQGRICLVSAASVPGRRYERLIAALPGLKVCGEGDLADWLDRLRMADIYAEVLRQAVAALRPWFDDIEHDSGAARLVELIARMARGG